ncbi:MAG: hypothetical protein JNL28_07770 [Planctomycetes bacterium]|nr:hypothetical protein [Planctomycetota bacterium]
MDGVAWFIALASFALLSVFAGLFVRRRPIAAAGALTLAFIPPLGMVMIPVFC